MKRENHLFYQPKTYLVLYVLLLITTPFLLLQNYLQTAIGKLSELSFGIVGIQIPYVLFLAMIFALIAVFLFRKNITLYRVVAVIGLMVLWIIGQKLTDYYFNHKFYELQHNWHYIAYGIFSYLIYRYLKSKEKPIEKIFLFTFIGALSCSIFDEIIQIYISGRIFDIGDIGKDVWGAVMGMIFIAFVLQEGEIFRVNKRLRFRKIKEYFNNPFTILFYELLFTIIFLSVSSLFTEMEYLKFAILIPSFLFLCLFLIIHLLQFKLSKKIIIIVITFSFLVQAFFFMKYRKENIIYSADNLIVYKGIPIPFFDVMIFPNGTFRLVDKKAYFNERDKNKIYHNDFDILLISTGFEGEGGLGFSDKTEIQFIYNSISNSAFQLFLLKNNQAYEEFNRLKKEEYNVLFIIHNS